MHIYVYVASPVTVTVFTDLLSIRGKRKGVRQLRSAREVLEDLKGGADSTCMHITRWYVSILVYVRYYLVHSNLSAVVMS